MSGGSGMSSELCCLFAILSSEQPEYRFKMLSYALLENPEDKLFEILLLPLQSGLTASCAAQVKENVLSGSVKLSC